MSDKQIKIAHCLVSNDAAPFIIAELSGNHNQDLELAKAMIKSAAEAGVDAIKLQTYTADSMTLNIDSDNFRIMEEDSLWYGRHLHELYQQAATPYEWHKTLFDYANSLGLVAFSSPFDESAVDFLESLDVPAYKIASFELTDLPLVAKAASTKKPLIMSTGMASEDEISDAVATAKQAGCDDIILLKCTSTYPASPENTNLNTLPDLYNKYECLVGLSDHTQGTAVAIASVALGACIIEKHFVLDRNAGGVDAAFSLEPSEFKHLCEQSKLAKQALGDVVYGGTAAESKSKYYRRSIFAYKDIASGETLSADNIKIVRPSIGLAPKYWPELMGRKLKVAIKAGTPIKWDLLV